MHGKLAFTALIIFFAATPGLATAETPAAKPSAVATDPILVESLKCVTIQTDRASSAEPGAPGSADVNVAGAPAETAEALSATARPFIGQPITRESLLRLKAGLEAVAAPKSGYVWQGRYPRQEITSGNLLIELVQIPELTGSLSSLRNGAVSGTPYTAAPALQTEKSGSSTAYVIGLDNQASRKVGDERFYGGAQIANLTGNQDALRFLLIGGFRLEDYRGISLNYSLPFAQTWQFETGVSASETHTNSSGSLENDATSYSIRPRLTKTLPSSSWLRHQVYLAANFSDTRYRQTVLGVPTTYPLKMVLLEPSWAADIKDAWGSTTVQAGLVINPGWAGEDADYRILGGEDAHYVLSTLELRRRIKVGTAGFLHLRALGQWSEESLVSSNRFYASGQSRVRGYDENLLNADRAAFGSAEFFTPAFALPRNFSLQPSIFLDGALLDNAASDETDISSVGLGLRLRWKKGFLLRLDAAQGLSKITNKDEKPMVHFSITQRW